MTSPLRLLVAAATVALAGASLAACAPAADDDLCAQAAAHVADCTGEAPTAAPQASCDQALAGELLGASCPDLAAAAAAGKADGWWSDFLCFIGNIRYDFI